MTTKSNELSGNILAPTLGILGEMVVLTHLTGKNTYEFDYLPHGDGGVDITHKGVKYDVKTTRSDQVAAYIISKRAEGSFVDLRSCDYYICCRCVGWSGIYPSEFAILGQISSEKVANLQDIKSPLASHYNKVVKEPILSPMENFYDE